MPDRLGHFQLRLASSGNVSTLRPQKREAGEREETGNHTSGEKHREQPPPSLAEECRAINLEQLTEQQEHGALSKSNGLEYEKQGYSLGT